MGPIHPVQHNYAGYLFKVLQNQLENYSTFLEDVYKSTILLQFLCTDIKLGLCENRGFIPLVLAETLESVLNAPPQEVQTNLVGAVLLAKGSLGLVQLWYGPSLVREMVTVSKADLEVPSIQHKP